MGRDEVCCWIESGPLPISVVGATLTGPISSTGWNARAARKQKMTEKHSSKMAQGSRIVASWNQMESWLRLFHQFRAAA
jgi:hypothetical protein